MLRRIVKVKLFLLVLAVSVLVVLSIITNVSTTPTLEDVVVFKDEFKLQKPERPLTYEEELVLIRKIQSQILGEYPMGPGIPEEESREPKDLIRFKQGLCYDRSRTYDKVFNWLGFEARHLYLLYPYDPHTGERLSNLRAFFTKGTESHAVTEVKTAHGWLVVDSNVPWVSLDINGEPVRIDQIYEKRAMFANMPEAYQKDLVAIPGMYSRRGQFYRPYIPYPELNWPDFFQALWQRK